MRSLFDAVMEFGGPLLAAQSNGAARKELKIWFNDPEQAACRRLLSGGSPAPGEVLPLLTRTDMEGAETPSMGW